MPFERIPQVTPGRGKNMSYEFTKKTAGWYVVSHTYRLVEHTSNMHTLSQIKIIIITITIIIHIGQNMTVHYAAKVRTII